MRPIRLLEVGFFILTTALVACTSASQRSSIAPLVPGPGALVVHQPQAQPARLITMSSQTGRLEAWPVQRGGGGDPEPFTPPLNLGDANPLLTFGDVVAMTGANPPRVILYNVKTATTRLLPDPFGTPIGIAAGKDATIYAINIAKKGAPVTMYRPPAHRAVELSCGLMNTGEAIAVDNEGDIFIDGYGKDGNVVEIPNGPNGPEPQNCVSLPLKGNAGYVAGIAVDPKTDDLITLDDPSLCAGGEEGRMTIYSKPYNKLTGRSIDIGMNCSGGLWLNADATIVYTSDEDVSGSFGFILQRSFPDGGDMGIYHSRNTGGFAPMPGTLPD